MRISRMRRTRCVSRFLVPRPVHVSTGGNCSGCHGGSTTGRDNITGNSGLLTLSSRLDGGIPGTYKVFNVLAGTTVPLTINVTNGGLDPAVKAAEDPLLGPDKVGVAITGSPKAGYTSLKPTETLTSSWTLTSPGVLHGIQSDTGHSLTFAQDTAWTGVAKSDTTGVPTYNYVYFDKSTPAAWTGSTQTYTYNLAVDASTPSDVYSLFLRATGVDDQGGGAASMWTQGEEVLIHVTPAPEPGTLALLAAAGIFVPLGAWRWRRRTG